MLEKDFSENYYKYKKTGDKAALNSLLKQLEPTIAVGVRTFGQNLPVMQGKARLLAKHAIDIYDPKRGALKNHIILHLQRLQRLVPKASNIISVPEAVRLQARELDDTIKELSDRLGRQPSDQEISDTMGISLKRLAKLRTAQGAVPEATFEGTAPVVPSEDEPTELWREVIYKELGPVNQSIMERYYGLHGHKRQSASTIAQELKLPASQVYNAIKDIDTHYQRLKEFWK